ncbi:MAG: efflux RND transporter periplasmic adaptor subunit [Pseudomonadota bacterium]
MHAPNPPSTITPAPRRSKAIGIAIAVFVMAALAGLAWYLTQPDEAAQGGPGAPGGGGGRGGGGRGGASTVGVATAQLTDIPVVLDALGTVTAAATATVRPQVSGILQKINFSEGQLVKAGQVLAVIDPRSFEMALLQASGQRQRNAAQLEAARVTLERFRTLLAQDSIARQEVDTQAALVKQLEGSVMTDRAAEGIARLNLSHTQIKAPISGRVGLRVTDLGNLVGSGDANGIAVITQLSPIDVEFAVPQDQVPELQPSIASGASLPAVAFDRTRTRQLETGKFAALDNQVDTQTGTVRAKARFANAAQALFPSQFVNLRLEMRTIKDAVVVPVAALRHGSSGDFVYVLNAAERTVSLRPVTRGQAAVDKVEIKTGLKAGEQVITEGADRLKDGAKVTLPGDKPSAGGRRGEGGARGERGARGQGRGEGRRERAPDAAPAAAAPVTATPAPATTPASVPAATPVPAGEAAAGAERPRRRWREEGARDAEGAPAGERPRRRREEGTP